MTDPYDYITGAKKRVWLAIQGNPRYVDLLIESALKRALRGADVRIVTDHVMGLYVVVGRFVRKNGAFVENLSIAEAPVASDIYIIDDKAWIRINGTLTEIDVKEAEGKFKEILKGDERMFEKSRNKRTEILVSGAIKRVLAVIPRISKDGIRALIERASDGVDIYVITNDKLSFISTIERLMRNNGRRLVRATRRMMLWDMVKFLVAAIFIGLPILFYSLLPEPKALSFSILLGMSLPLVLIPLLIVDDLVNKEYEDAEDAIRMMKKASKRLNVLKAPVAEEFYVVDDRAWAVRDDGRLIEINARSAEEEFARLWRMYEGPWVLGKDAKQLAASE